MTVDERWNQVLDELPAIGKNSTNSQQGFKYRSIDDVLDRLSPLFAKHGVHPVPVRQHAERDQRPTRSGGVLNVCYITVDWEIRSVDGDKMFAQTLGEGTDSGDKSTSKAQTMALKYLLWPSLAIATNEDPDGTTVEESTSRVSTRSNVDAPPKLDEHGIPQLITEDIHREGPPSTLASAKQVGYLKRLLDEAGVAPSEWAKVVNETAPPWPDGLHNLSKAQMSLMIDAYKP